MRREPHRGDVRRYPAGNLNLLGDDSNLEPCRRAAQPLQRRQLLRFHQPRPRRKRDLHIQQHANDASFLVYKNFTDDNPQDVPVTLQCTSGNVVSVDPNASESDPADFTIEGITAGTACNATETATFPYYQQSSNCTGVLVTIGGTSSCTFVNAIIPPGENPVGGIVGLIEQGQTPRAESEARDRSGPVLAAATAGLLLILASAWYVRRRWI